MPRKELVVSTRTNLGIKGFFRLQTIDRFSGKCRIDTGWFPNTILTSGRNVMADGSTWMNFCQVGTDNTAATPAQTSLLGYHAGTSTIQSTTTGQASSAPYYGWKRKVFRFGVGTVAANLQEVGVGWATSGSTLISRARILDPILGTPTVVTPLADEFLDVTYELRYYAPTDDVTSPSVTLDGTTYDTTTRAAVVTDAIWSSGIGTTMGAAGSYTGWKAYDGNIGTVLTNPSGSGANCDVATQFNSTYSNNSYEIVMNCLTGSTGWNLGSGIRSIRISTTAGAYQTQFEANPGGTTIPKTSAYTISMRWTLAWAEL
jgi:hypothetical protein